MKLTHLLEKHRFYFWLFIFALGSVASTVAQEKPQLEKRWVRWRLIEVARKSLADSILVQLQQGVSFQKLARQHSLHASAKEGGEIGWSEFDSVDSDFKIAIASLPIGTTSAILQKKNYFFVLHKMNELPESGYLQWKKQKSEVDSLLKRIDSLINTGNNPAAMTLLKEAEEQVKQIEDEGTYLRMLNSKGSALMGLSQFKEATSLFDLMLKASRTIGDTYWEGVAWGNLGEAHRSLDQYPRATAYSDSALVIARAIGNRAGEGRWLGNLGNVYFSSGQYQQAIAYFDSALGIAREIGDRKREGDWLGALGNAYRLLGQYSQAMVHYDSALVIARKIGDRKSEGGWLGSLGNSCFVLSQYQQAIAYYASALGIAREFGVRRDEGGWLGSLGNAYFRLGQYQRAIEYYDSALGIARKIGDQRAEAAWLGNLGSSYQSLGQYQKAIAYYDSGLVIARKIGGRQAEGGFLGILGTAYRWLGQYQRAIAYSDSALSIARKIGDRQAEGVWLGNLGVAYKSLGQYQRAIAYSDSALSIARKIGGRQAEGACLGDLGVAYESLGQYQQAIAYYDSALGIAREIGDREGEGRHLGNLGEAYRSLGLYPQAITYADSALFIAKEIADAENIWQRYWSLAKSHSKTSETKRNEVINFYDNAVAALENITGQLVQDVHKLSYVQDKQKLYVDYINYLVAQPEPQYHEKALEISEASRTRALRDLLHGQRTQSPLTEEKRLAAMKYTEELFAAHTAAQSELLAASKMTRAGAEKRLEDWAQQITIPSDTLASTATAPVIQLQDIQAEARNATLLEYHVLDDGVVIWVVDQTGKVFAVKQNIAKEKLRSLIDSVRQVLEVEGFVKSTASRKKARTPLLQTLDALLIRPMKDYLPKDSNQPLVILPHDVLFLLPFACLMDSSGQYLAQRYTFSTAPSVGLLKFTREKIREQQDRENPKLLLMGNPKMPDEMWLPLPGAEKEVKLIADQVNRKKEAGFSIPHAAPRQALPLTKAQATEAEFRQIASVHNYIHLATHGYVVSDALRCGLVLAKTGETMETDGILTTAEIFGLQLNAELVVLSACQTGLGEISSDGVAGLSRAFLYAGVSSLIVSLWTVSDEVTQELMVKFYEELAVDGNKARALRAAQLATMKIKKYSHPKDWAGFVLVGQPR